MERIIEQSISDVFSEYLRLTDGPVYVRAWHSSRRSTMILGMTAEQTLSPIWNWSPGYFTSNVAGWGWSPQMRKFLHGINEGGKNLILFCLEKVSILFSLSAALDNLPWKTRPPMILCSLLLQPHFPASLTLNYILLATASQNMMVRTRFLKKISNQLQNDI